MELQLFNVVNIGDQHRKMSANSGCSFEAGIMVSAYTSNLLSVKVADQ